MKRLLVGLLIVLVVWIIFRTRREYYPTIPFNTDQLTTLQHPGYSSTSNVSLRNASLYAIPFLSNASPTVADYNAIVSAIQYDNPTLTLTQYSSVPSFTADSSGSTADRLVMRAIAYWPFQMYKIASNVSLSAYNLNTSGTVGSVTTAAQVLNDIRQIIFNSGSRGTVTNINNALQSGMTGFNNANDFYNFFTWTPTPAAPFDSRVSYLLNFITATFGNYYQTTISGWQLDPAYNPITLGSFLTGSGVKWYPNQYLVSPGKQFFTIMQPDGNLVTYEGSGPTNNQGFLWAIPVPSSSLVPNSYALLNTSGDFLVMNPSGGAVWHASTSGGGGTGPWKVSLDDNGTLSVTDSTGKMIWSAPSTWTSQGCFVDTQPRVIPNYLGTVSSVQQCQQQAANAGYNVIGIENGDECWAGTNLSYNSLGTATNCNNNMGGVWSFNAYTSTGFAATPSAAQSLLSTITSSDSTLNFSPAPTGYYTQSSPVFTFSFDIYIVNNPTNWMTVFDHGGGYTQGGNATQRHPSVYLSGTALNSSSSPWPQPRNNRVQIVMAGNGGGGTGDNQEVVTPQLSAGKWYNITFTVAPTAGGSGNILTGYLNGTSFGTANGNFTWGTPDQPWTWFSSANASVGKFYINNARFWTRVISASEISGIQVTTALPYTMQNSLTFTAPGTDLPNQPMSGTLATCELACTSNNNCLGFSWPQNGDPNTVQQCYLKQNMSSAVPTAGYGWVSYVNGRTGP